MARSIVGFSAVPVPGGYRLFMAFNDGMILTREDTQAAWTKLKVDLQVFVAGGNQLIVPEE